MRKLILTIEMSEKATAKEPAKSESPKVAALKQKLINLQAKNQRIAEMPEDRREQAAERNQTHIEQVKTAIKQEGK